MKRRDFIMLLGGGAAAMWPLAARAQQFRPRIAVLSLNTARDEGKVLAAFLDGMRALGYVDGQNIDLDYRYASGDPTDLAALARELIAVKPNLALATSPSPAMVLKGVAPELPIVCASVSDSLMPSHVASYAQPGGSVTGIASSVEGMYGKLLELALDIIPGTARIGFLANPAGASMTFYAEQVAAAARARGIVMLTKEARTPDDLDRAYDVFAKQQVHAVIIPANGLFVTNGSRIAQLALAARLPTIFPDPRDVEAGGLASYGVDLRENYRRAAVYVDKILKGAKPGDLPVEFPTKLVLVINLKTAKALDISIPATMIGRADEVIE
jgi:putative ABC transport system substrate-binding protein